ncbi:hypothetical protein [Streptomyces sp. NPDC050548]|uniref:hypothetical protein n=1 Tax=Streptomyces sp. NPDC050548 TaxID=3365629 RepID=UPI00379CF354
MRMGRTGFGKTKALISVGFVIVTIASGVAYHFHGSAEAEATSVTSQHLAIHEWGVNLPIASNINDAYYAVSTSTRDPLTGEPNTVWVGLSSLSNKGCDATRFSTTGEGSPVGAIIRVLPTDTDPVTGTAYTQKYPGGATVGGYYYVYIPWKSAVNCASQSTITGINTSFENASKGVAKPQN